MRPLPRPIARWADELAALSEEARNLLGPWLPMLERVRGAISLPHAQGEGEPDGLAGLSRRGPYARLVATEWALLEAAPDEFVRRAGAGEHLFNEIARAEASGAGRIVALFDAGPWQLGAPRLAHLAWLLVLARHARSRSTHLVWGVVQAPGEGLRDSTEPGDIRALMAARTRQAIDPAMIDAWAGRLGSLGKLEERWLITHARDDRAASQLEALTLAVAEPAESEDPVASSLVVAATSRASARAGTVLPLPPRRTCGRLLRDPLRNEPGEDRPPSNETFAISSGAQVVFSATSPHVLARLESGQIVALLVVLENKRSIQQLARFQPPPGSSVVAAGWRKGKMYVVTSDETQLALHVSRGGRWRAPMLFAQDPGLSMPVSSPSVLGRLFIDRDGAKLWFCDERWRLHVLDVMNLTATSPEESVVAWGVLPATGGVASVQRAPGGPLELRTMSRLGSSSVRLTDPGHRVSLGFVVPTRRGAEPAFVALGAGDGGWQLCVHAGVRARVRLSADTPVYGAALVEGHRCLLIRSSARERLDFFDGKEAIASLTFPDEVEHACLHANGHWIAAQVGGALYVVDRRGEVYLRWGGPWG